MSRAVALTIAGSDPSGGAGLQTDLKVFHQFGVYGEAVVTLLTVQNTVGVARVEVMGADLVGEQIRAVVEDIEPGAAKTGALGSVAVIERVAEEAKGFGFPLVVDPVMVSKHGAALMAEEARRKLVELLLPRCRVVMPNLHEAAVMTGRRVETVEEMEEAGRALLDAGAGAVLMKGGHLEGEALDLLVTAEGILRLHGERVETVHTHGTGCSYAAALTALLARGEALGTAALRAKRWIQTAIATNPGLGRGQGPVNQFAEVE